MRRNMNVLFVIFATVSILGISCNSQTQSTPSEINKNQSSKEKTEVITFHSDKNTNSLQGHYSNTEQLKNSGSNGPNKGKNSVVGGNVNKVVHSKIQLADQLPDGQSYTSNQATAFENCMYNTIPLMENTNSTLQEQITFCVDIAMKASA